MRVMATKSVSQKLNPPIFFSHLNPLSFAGIPETGATSG
jgi:hypothetical protein